MGGGRGRGRGGGGEVRVYFETVVERDQWIAEILRAKVCFCCFFFFFFFFFFFCLFVFVCWLVCFLIYFSF